MRLGSSMRNRRERHCQPRSSEGETSNPRSPMRFGPTSQKGQSVPPPSVDSRCGCLSLRAFQIGVGGLDLSLLPNEFGTSFWWSVINIKISQNPEMETRSWAASSCCSRLTPKMGKWALAQKAMKRKDQWQSGIMFTNGFTSPSFSTALDLKAAIEMEILT